MLWDNHTKNHIKRLAHERERAMRFHMSTIAAPGLFESQRRFMLGQAMDLNTMVWTVGLFLALQWHHGDMLLSLGREDFGQGAQQFTSMKDEIDDMVGKTKRISRFEQ